jgi:hypothetical protein
LFYEEGGPIKQIIVFEKFSEPCQTTEEKK